VKACCISLYMCKVGQNHTYVYGIFGREITKYTAIHGVYIQFGLILCACSYVFSHVQGKVTAHSEAHHAETRWFWQRALDLVNDKKASVAWLQQAVPDTIAEWWSILLFGLVREGEKGCLTPLRSGGAYCCLDWCVRGKRGA
jgi:hypothetical protein